MNVHDEQEKAVSALNKMKDRLGTWYAVGETIEKSAGGSADSWMVIANAVGNKRRRASHRLLVSLGIRKPRKRFSCDIPDWMSADEEECFRAMMRETAEYHAWAIEHGRSPGGEKNE